MPSLTAEAGSHGSASGTRAPTATSAGRRVKATQNAANRPVPIVPSTVLPNWKIQSTKNRRKTNPKGEARGL